MQGTDLFTHTLNDLRFGARRVILQGGQWSGKTVNALGALATLCAEEEPSGDEPIVTTVTSMSTPHLKGGALRDFESFVYPSFKNAISQYHKTDRLFTFKSGMQMEFRSFENEMTARGAKRKRLFVNEANSFPPLLFFQLDSRSEQTVIDYNPSVRFFAHNDLIGQPGNKLYISDHRHNPFLKPDKHKEIENICIWETDEYGNKILDSKGHAIIKKGDYELWKVYARGLTGNITGIIFPNWEMIDDDLFPTDVDYVFSIDFGYTVDPTCIIKQCLIGDTLFLKELCYEPGIPTKRLIQILKADGFRPDIDPLYCEHDADMIHDLRKHGCPYADLARKGQGSINAGIELLKGLKVKYTNSSKNLHREIGLYVWDTDKITGKAVNIPVDRHNHAIDAVRYGAYTRYLRT